MLADQLDYLVGVDPHRDTHALAIVDVRTAGVVFEASVEASGIGYARALELARSHAPGRRSFAIEGAGSFGAGLSRFLSGEGERVLEVGRLQRERRSGGKSDALDAIRAARSVLAEGRAAEPRAGGEREALRALMAAREGAVNARRAALCQLRGPADHDTGVAPQRAAAADPRSAAASTRLGPPRPTPRRRAPRDTA